MARAAPSSRRAPGRRCGLPQYDILLHADEVITGFGRTGKWFGSHTYGIQPRHPDDGEGAVLRLSADLGGGPGAARVGDAIAHANEEMVHGYTYSGHPVACAVALKNLEIMQREKIVERVGDDIGRRAKFREVLGDHPLVGEVRGVGLLCALELVDDKAERRFFPEVGDVGTICRNHCFREGLVMRAIRDTMVCSPPLTITRDEVDQLVALAKRCFDLTARDLGRL